MQTISKACSEKQLPVYRTKALKFSSTWGMMQTPTDLFDKYTRFF